MEKVREMKSRVIQLCTDVGTWNMMVILGLERIQLKREIVRIFDLNTSWR